MKINLKYGQLVKVKVVFGPPVQCLVIERCRTEPDTYFVETLQADMLYMKGERILANADDITPLDEEEEPADIIDWIVAE